MISDDIPSIRETFSICLLESVNIIMNLCLCIIIFNIFNIHSISQYSYVKARAKSLASLQSTA